MDSDTAMDAVSDVVTGIIGSLEKDLAESAEDGYLERPTAAYVIMLHGLLKRIDGARDMISPGQVSGWCDQYMAWLKSATSDLGEEYAKDLRKDARKEFNKLKALAEAPDEDDEAEDDGICVYARQSPTEDTVRDEITIEEHINELKEYIADRRKTIGLLGIKFTLHRQYEYICRFCISWGEILWQAGQSPAEPFKEAIAVTDEWLDYVAITTHAPTDCRRGGIEIPALIEFLLGSDHLYQHAAALGDWTLIDWDYKRNPSTLEAICKWTILECLLGIDRLARLKDLVANWDEPTRQEYMDYHDLIAAGIQGDSMKAQAIIHRRVASFEQECEELHEDPQFDYPRIRLEDERLVQQKIHYLLAAIVKAFDIEYTKPCAHLWRWD
jgi:hypothetical protein